MLQRHVSHWQTTYGLVGLSFKQQNSVTLGYGLFDFSCGSRQRRKPPKTDLAQYITQANFDVFICITVMVDSVFERAC